MLQPARQQRHLRCAPPFILVSAAGVSYRQTVDCQAPSSDGVVNAPCAGNADKLQLRTEVRNSSPDRKRDIELCIDPNNPRILLLLPRRQAPAHTAVYHRVWEQQFASSPALLCLGCMLTMEHAPAHMARFWRCVARSLRCVLQWCGGCPLADVCLLRQVVPPAGRFVSIGTSPPCNADQTSSRTACVAALPSTMCRDC
jgi:hypothetical protein